MKNATTTALAPLAGTDREPRGLLGDELAGAAADEGEVLELLAALDEEFPAVGGEEEWGLEGGPLGHEASAKPLPQEGFCAALWEEPLFLLAPA
jgi:hypothetical protein